jgi:hypothetical protein
MWRLAPARVKNRRKSKGMISARESCIWERREDLWVFTRTIPITMFVRISER